MPDSRFPETASLISVSWFDIKVKFLTKNLSPNTTYGVYFVYKQHPAIGRCYSFEFTPRDASVIEADDDKQSIVDDEHPCKKFYLKVPACRLRARPERCPSERKDGCLEVEMGRYRVADNVFNEKQVLVMRIKQFKDPIWKSGIVVDGMELRPLD